eukprot:TRINITY_DN1284_c0_g1_i1.p1 TRINITY_DN1284_c0_g1~~TRINITY_DN1284_c0_g1_i1.p1  ORF type:complete len:472 (+),score=50.78 TRINITY_DN1284_c0_g1_i1:81-1496(+)
MEEGAAPHGGGDAGAAAAADQAGVPDSGDLELQFWLNAATLSPLEPPNEYLEFDGQFWGCRYAPPRVEGDAGPFTDYENSVRRYYSGTDAAASRMLRVAHTQRQYHEVGVWPPLEGVLSVEPQWDGDCADDEESAGSRGPVMQNASPLMQNCCTFLHPANSLCFPDPSWRAAVQGAAGAAAAGGDRQGPPPFRRSRSPSPKRPRFEVPQSTRGALSFLRSLQRPHYRLPSVSPPQRSMEPPAVRPAAISNAPRQQIGNFVWCDDTLKEMRRKSTIVILNISDEFSELGVMQELNRVARSVRAGDCTLVRLRDMSTSTTGVGCFAEFTNESHAARMRALLVNDEQTRENLKWIPEPEPPTQYIQVRYGPMEYPYRVCKLRAAQCLFFSTQPGHTVPGLEAARRGWRSLEETAGAPPARNIIVCGSGRAVFVEVDSADEAMRLQGTRLRAGSVPTNEAVIARNIPNPCHVGRQ